MDENFFFSSVLFEMIKSSSFDRELSKLKFSESEEDSGKENKKITQHDTKEVVSNPNSKVRIQKILIILILCIGN